MLRQLRIYLFFALACSSINQAFALNCTTCLSFTGWENCNNQSKTMECSVAMVNEIHEGLIDFNPTLEIVDESSAANGNARFQCFSVELESKELPAGESDRGFASGFCEGWSNITRLIKCHTCETEGICSLNKGSWMFASSSWVVLVGLLVLINPYE